MQSKWFKILAVIMVPPCFMTFFFMPFGILHAFWLYFSDAELDDRGRFLLEYLAIVILPCVLTFVVTWGLFYAKRWALNLGICVSLSAILVAVLLVNFQPNLFTIAFLFACIAYSILFLIARISISREISPAAHD